MIQANVDGASANAKRGHYHARLVELKLEINASDSRICIIRFRKFLYPLNAFQGKVQQRIMTSYSRQL